LLIGRLFSGAISQCDPLTLPHGQIAGISFSALSSDFSHIIFSAVSAATTPEFLV